MSKPYFVKEIEGKLKLCSRDIQVGDKYYYSDTETEICDSKLRLEQIKEQEELHGQKRFKVIGEVSPEATFVKEHQEFDEDDLDFYWNNCIVEGKHITKSEWKEHGQSLSKTPENVLVKIRCKCCHKFC